MRATSIFWGHTHASIPKATYYQTLSRVARARLSEGVRISDMLGNMRCTFIFSGSHDHPQVMSLASRELGFKGRIIMLNQARDTDEEAQALYQLEFIKSYS